VGKRLPVWPVCGRADPADGRGRPGRQVDLPLLRAATWQEHDADGRRVNRTLGMASLGGATLDVEPHRARLAEREREPIEL
jgi:hypothetical protein